MSFYILVPAGATNYIFSCRFVFICTKERQLGARLGGKGDARSGKQALEAGCYEFGALECGNEPGPRWQPRISTLHSHGQCRRAPRFPLKLQQLLSRHAFNGERLSKRS